MPCRAFGRLGVLSRIYLLLMSNTSYLLRCGYDRRLSRERRLIYHIAFVGAGGVGLRLHGVRGKEVLIRLM
jgi:hypothetical protein